MKASLTVFFEDPFWVGVFPSIEMEIRQAADNPKRRSRNARKQLEKQNPNRLFKDSGKK